VLNDPSPAANSSCDAPSIFTSVPFSPAIVTSAEATVKLTGEFCELPCRVATSSSALARYCRLSIRTTKSATFSNRGNATPVKVTVPAGSSGCSGVASMSTGDASAVMVSRAVVSGTTKARPCKNWSQAKRVLKMPSAMGCLASSCAWRSLYGLNSARRAFCCAMSSSNLAT
jgi:hypothetical protein